MDADERDIFQFLKSWSAGFMSYREIARRAGGKARFHKNPDWAKPSLTRMQERGILDSDAQGRYRVRPVVSKHKRTRWVSPEIARILQEKGVTVEDTIIIPEDGSEEHYERL
jgi:hypothetical protein